MAYLSSSQSEFTETIVHYHILNEVNNREYWRHSLYDEVRDVLPRIERDLKNEKTPIICNKEKFKFLAYAFFPKAQEYVRYWEELDQAMHATGVGSKSDEHKVENYINTYKSDTFKDVIEKAGGHPDKVKQLGEELRDLLQEQYLG